MKHILYWMLLFVWVGQVEVEAKINVVTTTTDLAAIVKEIGGEEVSVQAIAKGYQDPHYVQAKPSYMRVMNRADLLVYVGLELEVGWLPLLIQGARNPQIMPGAVGHLDASVGVRRLDVPTGGVDRSMGDVHPEGNPHYWRG
ncbi:MAG: zinc ABC transporter solute-binding protein [Candidatus Latescibacteria bacterium]|jgi:zinc/manganese transport system substrate-binding protein|nr:zinc ABC transporter solute-binding protein [Candidatus Latescibacterota bacterium]MBT4137841.1 zinc ABC transporter solute-binding protein [Candidatus Latescibacterota bacterium]MBT5831510.1 zinc ABC transporter solute-binding protein [Candidatus Latescibacterota bacterium]